MSSLRATDGYNEAAFEDGSGYSSWTPPAEDDDDGFYADQILRDAGIYVAPYVAPESVRRGTLPPLFLPVPRSFCGCLPVARVGQADGPTSRSAGLTGDSPSIGGESSFSSSSFGLAPLPRD